MKKFSVTVGVTLNAYEEVEIEAENEAEAELKVGESIKAKGFDSDLITELVFEPEWNSMEDLRVLAKSSMEDLRVIPSLIDLPEGEESVNHLEGMACPGCGSTEAFKIEVRTMVTMYDSGSTDAGDEQWDGGDFCGCIACGRFGKVRQFRKGASKKGKE